MAVDDFEIVKTKFTPANWRFWAVLHAFLAVPPVVGSCTVVPRLEAIFLDFGVPLPTITNLFLGASHAVVRHALVTFAALATLYAIDVTVLRHLALDRFHPERATLWGLFWSIVLLLLIPAAVFAFVLPFLSITTSLSS